MVDAKDIARVFADTNLYGRDAAALWSETDGKCQLCDRQHGEVCVQVHHIDENKKNGHRSNIAILCFDCHQATHRLLTVKNRDVFLTWFESTYGIHQAGVR